MYGTSAARSPIDCFEGGRFSSWLRQLFFERSEWVKARDFLVSFTVHVLNSRSSSYAGVSTEAIFDGAAEVWLQLYFDHTIDLRVVGLDLRATLNLFIPRTRVIQDWKLGTWPSFQGHLSRRGNNVNPRLVVS